MAGQSHANETGGSMTATLANNASLIAGAGIALLVLIWFFIKFVVSAVTGHALVQWYLRKRQQKRDQKQQNDKRT